MTREEIDADIRAQIARGELTPEQAESEWEFAVNGPDTFESVYGW